ncbi:hypothetical protein Taro_027551, partial [Colocasia esculenta]|nr:hypothetical protein [Colocasia esculenta]
IRLHAVDVVVYLLVMASRGEMSLGVRTRALAPVPQAQDHRGPSILERFKRMLPPSFKGERDPLLAESWMREIEKIFRAIRSETTYGGPRCYVLRSRMVLWRLVGMSSFRPSYPRRGAQRSVSAEGRDGAVFGGEEGFSEEACSSFPEVGEEEGGFSVTAASRGIGKQSDGKEVPEVQKQRAQDQGLSETSVGSPAWTSHNSSSSSASDRTTRETLSPSSSASTSVDADPNSAATLMDANQVLTASDLNVYLPDQMRLQIQKCLRICRSLIRKLFPNGGSLNIGEGFFDIGLCSTSTQNPDRRDSEGSLALAEESFFDL